MKILIISAEVAPFAKVGGLGDVAGSLPKALHELGHDVRVVMPAYQPILNEAASGRYPIEAHPYPLEVPIYGTTIAGVLEGRLPGSDVPIYFIAQDEMLRREKVYGYHDDAYRFAFFSRAALHMAVAAQDWKPDIVHAHDWHTAPAIVWLANAGATHEEYRGIKTVFTIHNLAHQGRTHWGIFDYLDLKSHSLHEEPYGQVNMMARGIYHATKINTVSPTYAREIMTHEGGDNLDSLLRYRYDDLSGILNGLDYDVWNPKTDPNLAKNFSVRNLKQRLENKRALQEKLGMAVRDDVPLLGMISRLDAQKGLNLLIEAVQNLMHSGRGQFVLLGSGEPEIEGAFDWLASQHRENMSATFAYRADLAPLIYAATDIFVMPSLFEPCGLGQLIAMRYGSIPLVRRTGGLADTVFNEVTGFTFDDFTAHALWSTIQHALYIYHEQPKLWREIQKRGMKSDFSWDRSAREYVELYEAALRA